MQRSESIAALAQALAKAQGSMGRANKDGRNPHFKSKYATLTSVSEACTSALTENGLAVIQVPIVREGGAGVITKLMHSSGEWISEELVLPVQKNDAQGVGSAITYARRYSLAGFAGVCPEDDDGNAAVASVQNTETAKYRSRIDKAQNIDELGAVWKETPPAIQNELKKDKDAAKARLLNASA